MHKTAAWPLALVYSALIVYASLYPFDEWHAQGVAPWAFVDAALPKYWTAFDVVANVLGYVPLGFLLALGWLRSLGGLSSGGLAQDAPAALARQPRGLGFVLLVVLGVSVVSSALSLVLEGLQTYLPSRVPSNLDLMLNSGGAVLGATAAGLLETAGAVARWSRLRARWFVPDARGALVLLALWPAALLFPAAVPLGLGQVLERLELAVVHWLEDTPFLQWLPLRDVELQPLVPAVEITCVVLGALVPCLLAYGIAQSMGRRAVLGLSVLAVGLGSTTLSAALSFGPEHAWAWLSDPVQMGLAIALGFAVLLLPLPATGCVAVLLIALVLQLWFLNQAPTSAYFADTLQTWEQGRFIRFHGLSQWLGWLWPFAAAVYAAARLLRRLRGS